MFQFNTPFVIVIYRIFALGITVLFFNQGFLHDEYMAMYKWIVAGILFPLSLICFIISWVRRSVSQMVMAIYSFAIPFAFIVAMRLLVLRNSPWWDFAIGFTVIMAFPVFLSWSFIKDKEVVQFYRHRQLDGKRIGPANNE